jgi:hypothetical protein
VIVKIVLREGKST